MESFDPFFCWEGAMPAQFECELHRVPAQVGPNVEIENLGVRGWFDCWQSKVRNRESGVDHVSPSPFSVKHGQGMNRSTAAEEQSNRRLSESILHPGGPTPCVLPEPNRARSTAGTN